MTDKVLVFIEDRVIKGIVLKVLHERKLEFLEGIDLLDLQLKLEIFQDTIFFHIIQINRNSYREQFEFIKSIKETVVFGFPVLAIIPSDQSDYVSGAKKADIEDVVLIPEKREFFREFFNARLTEFIKKIPVDEQKEKMEAQIKRSTSDLASDENLKQEINRAVRGKYSISFVMGKFTGVHIGLIKEFYTKLKKEMRDTDRIIGYDYNSFIAVCPFTVKSYLIEVEKKIRETFEEILGGYSRTQRLDMYGVTYPDDGRSIDKLVETMEKGVHDSIIISSIREPLNAISRDRLDEYRKMLKLYK